MTVRASGSDITASGNTGPNAKKKETGDADGADVIVKGELSIENSGCYRHGNTGRKSIRPKKKLLTPTKCSRYFMSVVVPWPGSPQEPGYVNLQDSYVDRKTPDGKKNGKWQPVSAGVWPFRDVGQLVNRAAWINYYGAQFKDVWFCTSLQSTAEG